MDNAKIPEPPFAWFELDHLGLTRHDLRAMLAAGQVRRVLHGVYTPTHLEDSIELRAQCAALVLRQHMVVADRTAAWLLEALLPRFRGRRGVVQLRELVPLATPLAESPGGSWTRLQIHDAGFPAPRPQCPIVVNGDEKYRLDLAYEQWKIAVEYDGRAHHTSPEARKRDKKRRTWLRRRGWIVIVVTQDDFRGHGDAGWLHELRAALDERMPTRGKRRYARAARAVQGRR